MSDLKPINREEAILSGEDLKPLSRKEYFLKKLGKSGGGEGGGGGTDSSLPPYTSEDIGKVLTVSTEDQVITETVIVPEQTVTLTEGYAELSNVTSYTGEEALTLGGDYADWVYRPEVLAKGDHVYSDPVLGDSKAISLHRSDGFNVFAVGSIVSALDGGAGYVFAPDTSVSGTSATISATATIPVVPTVSSVIAPRQNVTFEDGATMVSNVAISPEDVKPGTSVVATIITADQTDTFTLEYLVDLNYNVSYFFESDSLFIQFSYNSIVPDEWGLAYFYHGDEQDEPFSGDATIFIEKRTFKPKVKWENKGGTLYLNLNSTTGFLDASYSDIVDAIDNGMSVSIKFFDENLMATFLEPLYSFGVGGNSYFAEFIISGGSATATYTAPSVNYPLSQSATPGAGALDPGPGGGLNPQ